MTVDSTRTPWTVKAEAAIRTLRDIEGVSIQADGDEVREIHVVTSSSRPAKQIVRDVQTLLLTRFNQPIDHRVVSVAYTEPAAAPAEEGLPAPDPPGRPAPRRIRFVSANVYVSGPRVQAQVELKWNGATRMGSASGWSTRGGACRLIAAATIATVQEYLPEGLALSLEGVAFARLGNRAVAVVAADLLAEREQKALVGCCPVGQDRQQAVVLATLAALNRVFGGLHAQEPSAVS